MNATKLLHTVLNGSWPFAVFNNEDTDGTDTEEEGVTEADESQESIGTSSTYAILQAIMKQASTITKLVQAQKLDIKQIKIKKEQSGGSDVLAHLRNVVESDESEPEKERPRRNRVKK